MRPPTPRQKRLIAGIYLLVLLLVAGNRYLEWGILGQADRAALAVVTLLGVIAMGRFGPAMMEEMQAHEAAQREVEDTVERARDKSSDAEEAARLRRAIGMPPNKSLERTRER